MFIQTEKTPNPLTCKFLPGQVVMLEGTCFFEKKDTVLHCPLAVNLFALDGVVSVLFGSDFISITKTEETSWEVLRPFVFAALVDHFLSGRPLFLENMTSASDLSVASSFEEQDEISREICTLLETKIRPAVAQDGGDILFDRFENGIVYVHLQGACAGCPSSTATLKMGIENMLRHYVPEVEEVRAV